MSTGRHALAELIDAVEKANQTSDEAVARRARSMGHTFSKSNISRIRNAPVKSINPSQIRALADGLEVPITQVLRAALTAMGLPIDQSPPATLEGAVAADPFISARDRRLVLALLVTMRENPEKGLSKERRDKRKQDSQVDAAGKKIIRQIRPTDE